MTPATVKRILLGCVVAAFATLSASAFTMAWFMGANDKANHQAIDGEIGLRDYFYNGDDYRGDGSALYPYEIVLPSHFYNLTRLQNLGVFSEKQYFRLGHVFNAQTGPKCISGYDAEGDPIYVDYLDMSSYCADRYLLPIGSEGTPFCGEFDGRNLPIRGLKVAGNPQDIGVFGYISYEGNVENLILDGLTVRSLGYTQDSSDPVNILYSQEVDHLFDSTDYLATGTSLSYVCESAGENIPLKKSTGATSFSNINDAGSLVDSTFFRGYFVPTFPNVENDPFTYSIRSSSSLFLSEKALISGQRKDVLAADLSTLQNSPDFNSGDNIYVDTRISLIASLTVRGYTYSRVIQTYDCLFYSNQSRWADGDYSLTVTCDYLKDEDSYHHGNNIGFLAGHVDGEMSQCYVFDAHFDLNSAGLTSVAAESDTGLIGEVGNNNQNDISPELGLMVHGDTGVMNFSRIYSMIRSDFEVGDVTQCDIKGTSGGQNRSMIIYARDKATPETDSLWANDETFGIYREYLTHDESNPYLYVTSASGQTGITAGGESGHPSFTVPDGYKEILNSVDFLWNKVVCDEKGLDRGLGVFKIVTASNTGAKNNPGSYGAYWMDNIGDSTIINGPKKTKVYFSTAECDWRSSVTAEYPGWSPSDNTRMPARMNSLPSYSEFGPGQTGSFAYPFSRDFNYVFELDLADENKPSGKNYMYNTDSPFLTNYLHSILIDKYGKPVEPGSTRFGFMFRSSQNEILDGLSSYMKVGKPGNTKEYTYVIDSETGETETKYYPEKCIVFHVDNAQGANVSVVGSTDYISIYRINPDVNNSAPEEWFTMASKNTGEANMHRFFTYQFGAGEDGEGNPIPEGTTATKVEPQDNGMTDSGCLYGHIFKLPPGDYAIGTSKKIGGNDSARIYFLAVQGQNDGEIGAPDILHLGGRVFDVDFLLEKPTNPEELELAEFSFAGRFNTTAGEFIVAIDEDTGYIKLIFNQSGEYTTYLLGYCRKENPHFYFNDTANTGDTMIYPDE